MSTEADVVLIPAAPSSSTVVPTSSSFRSLSKASKSTARGSVMQGNTSNSGSIPSPGRFVVMLLAVLVIIPVMTLLDDF